MVAVFLVLWVGVTIQEAPTPPAGKDLGFQIGYQIGASTGPVLGTALANAAIILVVPIVMPLVNAMGIDPVHFGVIVTLNLAIGQQTPPVASVLMITCSIAKENVWDVTRANVPFIAVLLATLLLVTYVPVTTLGLVDLFYR